MALSNSTARSRSLASIADLARVISRLAVSLPEASQSAQMRFSTCLALSASGAALSAPNRKSRLRVRSPRCGFGRALGGCIGSIAWPCGGGLGGITVCADAIGVSSQRAAAEAKARAENRVLITPNLNPCRAAARWQLQQHA